MFQITALPSLVDALKIAICILALARLAGLFSHSVIVPVPAGVPSLWQTFNAATRLKFVTGITLLGVAFLTVNVLDTDKEGHVLALVVTALFCGIGGSICLFVAVSQHRYYLMQSSGPAERDRQAEFDLIALLALFSGAFFQYLLIATDKSTELGTVLLSAYHGAILLTITLAAISDTRWGPPVMKPRAENQSLPLFILMLLYVGSWSVMKDLLRDRLSPLFGYVADEIQNIAPASVDSVQYYYLALILSGFGLMLLLPYLQRWLKPPRTYPMTSSFVFAMIPAIFLPIVGLRSSGWTVPLSPFTVLLASLIGALIGLFLWYLCEALHRWLQMARTGRVTAKHPFHLLSVACLVALGWIGIFHVDGIDRYFVIIAQCAALSSWSIRRLS
ncbi:MAG: hypothetical protein JNL25_04420 [Rhodospirillaceae bacterium]|nr:hypothetical protein [Rhodospirillaceae bacterium]